MMYNYTVKTQSSIQRSYKNVILQHIIIIQLFSQISKNTFHFYHNCSLISNWLQLTTARASLVPRLLPLCLTQLLRGSLGTRPLPYRTLTATRIYKRTLMNWKVVLSHKWSKTDTNLPYPKWTWLIPCTVTRLWISLSINNRGKRCRSNLVWHRYLRSLLLSLLLTMSRHFVMIHQPYIIIFI